MQSICVHRYENPREVGWAGYIEPEDRTWIAFVGLDGRAVFYLDRLADGGVATPPAPSDPVRAMRDRCAALVDEHATGLERAAAGTQESIAVASAVKSMRLAAYDIRSIVP